VIPRHYQVIIIGGGHAGVEAAWAAANLLGTAGSLKGRPTKGRLTKGRPTIEPAVALITIDPSRIGVMSCNPAIGGLAKGQLVREIDALGGLMGLAADATGIQFKVLNTSRGPAVHGPRAQSDKHAYADAVQSMIAARPEIQVIAGTVERLVVERGRITGVILGESPERKLGEPGRHARTHTGSSNGQSRASADPVLAHGALLRAPAVILTTGTFMRGLMHTGENQQPGGRYGEAAATGISAALCELGFELGRLKTGTPPRISKRSIDWGGLAPAPGDDDPIPFSDLSGTLSPSQRLNVSTSQRTAPELALGAPFASLTRFPLLEQVDCRQTHTTAEIHDLIRANLHRAPMYSGQIDSTGPRYCPSIEDKVVRFDQRDTHGVFLEPESLRPPFDDWIYCNGISTSLPADVQDQIVRGMPGCQRAEILRYGYAVEYDMVRPHQIHATCMTKLIEGLFLAGQINGTSGYEEAAAQGIIAGINAARFARGQSEFILRRDQAYIGVLMDDLVTKTPVEPYRMFTSRAEHRLLLRPDNAADRLTPIAIELGLLHPVPPTTALSGRYDPSLISILPSLRREHFERRARQLSELGAEIDRARIDGMPLAQAIRRPEFSLDDLKRAIGPRPFMRGVWMTAFADRKYEAYIARQHAEIRRAAEMEHKRLPPHVDYLRFDSLRAEARQALARFRPATFGQASRLEGITPADLTLLAVLLRKSA
jgi:tRNA uridine 5-carboxymethylaminomethyl modification enzyme